VMVFLVAVAFSATGYSADKYVSLGAGISWLNNAEFDESRDWSVDRDGFEMDLGSGVSATGAIGCDYGDYRLEAEIGYQSGDVDSISGIENGVKDDADDFAGDESVLSLMGNAYYDIDLGGVELFLGAGVGVAQVDFDDIAEVDGNVESDYNWNASEVALAYQLMAGLAVPVSDGIMVEAKYRYFATTDFTVSNDDDEGLRNSDIEYNGNISSHSALLGLRVML